MTSLLFRWYNWCRRFRYRKGYGVHSPADFYFITSVIYERAAYHAYASLHERRTLATHLPHYREKTDRLLFRIANYIQPRNILEIGTGSGIETIYLAEGKHVPLHSIDETVNEDRKRIFKPYPNIKFLSGDITEVLTRTLQSHQQFDFIHIGHTTRYKECFEQILPHTTAKTCMIIGTPYANSEKSSWWKQVINDPRTGVTFDLYDIGIVFFNRKRVKEHRIVNFF